MKKIIYVSFIAALTTHVYAMQDDAASEKRKQKQAEIFLKEIYLRRLPFKSESIEYSRAFKPGVLARQLFKDQDENKNK